MLLNENLECINKQNVKGIYLVQEFWQNEKNVFLCTIKREQLFISQHCDKRALNSTV